MATTRTPRPKKARTSSARAHLDAVVDHLGVDEIRVLTSIAERLQFGAGAYGLLKLATDTREFRRREAREEIEDFLVYLACAWLRALEREPRKRPPRRRPPR
jgi:hypothetical protein